MALRLVWQAAFLVLCFCSEPRTPLNARYQQECDEPEVLSGSTRYNALVCAGIDKLERGNAAEAVRDLENASTMRLSESPNFRLFPRLALAYARIGDSTRSNKNLELARISLSVLVGIYRCHETPKGFIVLDQAGNPLAGAEVSEISRRMCGGIYESIYSRDSLEEFARDAKLVEHYLAILKQVRRP